MKLSRRKARWIGISAIAAVLILQAILSFGCYDHGLVDFVAATVFFLGIPLLPAIICLTRSNPLCSLGASMLLAPWLLLAFYTDCVRPYQGGGASMIYVAVLLWGTVSSLVGAALTGFVTKRMGIEIEDD